MTVRYKFESLQSLADHFDNKARDIREMAERYSIQNRPQRAREEKIRATAFEETAHVIRHTIIGLEPS